MATVTLHPFGSGPVRNRTHAPSSDAGSPRLPPFWSSLINGAPTAGDEPARTAAPAAAKSSAVVGDLWIQIR